MVHKGHVNEFEPADWVTYLGSVAMLGVWIAVSSFLLTFLNLDVPIWFLTWVALPPLLIGFFMGSRRWSAWLSKGPAAPLKQQ